MKRKQQVLEKKRTLVQDGFLTLLASSKKNGNRSERAPNQSWARNLEEKKLGTRGREGDNPSSNQDATLTIRDGPAIAGFLRTPASQVAKIKTDEQGERLRQITEKFIIPEWRRREGETTI